VFVAWFLARTDMPGRDVLEFFFWIAFFLPPLAVIQGWILLLDPDYGLLNQALAKLPILGGTIKFDVYTWWGIVWVHLMINTITIKVVLLTPAFRNMDATLEETSVMCGANRIVTLGRVVIPVMAPTVLVVLLMGVIRSLEAFEVELILGAPQRIDIYRLIAQEPPLFGAASVLSVIILLLMLALVVLQRQYTTKRRFTTVTGRFNASVIRLRKLKWIALLAVSILVCLLTIVPVIFLLMGTFMQIYGFFTISQPWTLKHWDTLFNDAIFLRSFLNTVILASGTALVGVIGYSVIAYIIVRTHFWGRAVLDYISWILFALPGIILGLGYLWLFVGVPFLRPFYGGIGVLILASVLSTLTLGVQTLRGTMAQLGFDLEEASWVVGGSKWQTCRLILFPILAPSLLLVGVICFVSVARSVSHLALLVTSNNRPLAMLQLDYMMEGRYEVASIIGVIVVMMTVGVALLARLFSARLGVRPSQVV
jgi:iron(III) transport system permease protein